MNVQCLLRRGNATRTEWVPTAMAVVGKVLKIRIDEEWDVGWVVERAFPGITRTDEELIWFHARLARYREHTDV